MERDRPGRHAEQQADEPAAPAVVDGATTGSLLVEAGTAAGILGMVAGGLIGWVVTLWARRRHPSGG